MQPTYRPQPGDLEQKLARAFPDDREQGEARRMLSSYGTAEFDSGVDRVRVAALYNSNGDLDHLQAQMELAEIDYRDVIAGAEYRAMMQLPRNVEAGSDAYLNAIEEDCVRYKKWLDS